MNGRRGTGCVFFIASVASAGGFLKTATSSDGPCLRRFA
jgi:hypothetical protein